MSYLAETLQNTITEITAEMLQGCNKIAPYVFYGCSALKKVVLPNSVLSIGADSFNGASGLTDLTINAEVGSIGASAFNGTSKIANIRFLHPAGATITLPTAGSTDGMFYVKTARAVNIYTDNETIKNYAWSTDGVTATLYHLDGSAWV